ncbi:MAG: pantoate--beta-alanine ligase [Sulfuriferula sp.]
MQIIHTIADMRRWRAENADVAIVPTMGNLHEGHISLARQARRHARRVIVSIFVNPLQFGANEDFSRYPRTLSDDCDRLREVDTDVVFAPAADTLFPHPQSYHVEPPALANELCGAFRPGHFRGVATIVLKFFNITQPCVALFGQKDYQQLAIIRGMVTDLNVPVDIVAGATVRAADGLALSSRNGFLSAPERAEAPRLYQTLNVIRDRLATGQRDFTALELAASATLAVHGWRVDYVAIRRRDLTMPASGDTDFVVLAAAHLGNTRLIDNIEVESTETL